MFLKTKIETSMKDIYAKIQEADAIVIGAGAGLSTAALEIVLFFAIATRCFNWLNSIIVSLLLFRIITQYNFLL